MVFLLACPSTLAQTTFDIKDASKNYDVRVEVAGCEDKICEGKATFTLFKKGSAIPFQVFRLADTSFLLNDEQKPTVNKTRLYDEQSAFSFGDYNFDGDPDLALCDGKNSGYGGPSYQIYLLFPLTKKFVHSPGFTRLAQDQYLGMFEVDSKRKLLRTFSKSGCCFHVMEEYSVVNNRPQKVFDETEDATHSQGNKVKITTRRLVNGRWRKVVRFEPRREN